MCVCVCMSCDRVCACHVTVCAHVMWPCVRMSCDRVHMSCDRVCMSPWPCVCMSLWPCVCSCEIWPHGKVIPGLGLKVSFGRFSRMDQYCVRGSHVHYRKMTRVSAIMGRYYTEVRGTMEGLQHEHKYQMWVHVYYVEGKISVSQCCVYKWVERAWATKNTLQSSQQLHWDLTSHTWSSGCSVASEVVDWPWAIIN